MITKTKQLTKEKLFHSDISNLLDPSMVFFDIETTGFSAASTKTYLIGCIHFDGVCFQVIQWFSQTPEDEAEVLHSFFSYIQKFRTLVHYNGEGFDMPYLMNRCRHFQLPYQFTSFQSMDLYKLLAPYKAVLKLENLKQKTVEHFLNIEREDIYQGGELISVYYEYLKQPSESSQNLLLLHNYDDLLGMVQLYPVISYYHLFHGEIQDISCRLHPYKSAKGQPMEEIIFSFTIAHPLPQKISFRQQEFYLTGDQSSGKLSVQTYKQELKYFFPNYKDYYYLPEEDISIHKSVAFYVDKNFRTQATAANCYNKKSGRFLPQRSVIITPYFKQNYKDKLTYFEVTDDFLNSQDQQLLYVKHILSTLK